MVVTKCISRNKSIARALLLYTFLLSWTSRTQCAPPSYSMVTPSSQYRYPIATVSPIFRKPVAQSITERPEADFDEYENDHPTSAFPSLKNPYFAPSQFLLTMLQTFVDVLRKVNTNKSKSSKAEEIQEVEPKLNTSSQSLTNETRNSLNSGNVKTDEKGREMDPGVIYDDHDYHHHYHDEPPPPAPVPIMVATEAPKEMIKQGRYSDPWEGYYEFLITEGSFKFWSTFQLATAGLLLYSALAAIYYAKFNPIQPDYDTTYDDYFFGRSLSGDAPVVPDDSASPAPGWFDSITGMGRAAYQRIMDAIESPGE